MYNDRMLSPSPAWMERGLGREASEVFPFRRGFSVATFGAKHQEFHGPKTIQMNSAMIQSWKMFLAIWDLNSGMYFTTLYFFCSGNFLLLQKPHKQGFFWWSVSGFFLLSLPQKTQLAGGFNYFLFPPLPGEMIHFDWYFSNGLKRPTRQLFGAAPKKRGPKPCIETYFSLKGL